MVVVLVALIYICILAFTYGIAAGALLQGRSRLWIPRDISLPLNGMLGLIVLAIITGYLTFFVKIGLAANILVILGAALLTFRYREEIRTKLLLFRREASRIQLPVWLIFALIAGLTILELIDIPKVGDSGLYHIQTIKWIESYRAVPGLGNLHGFFAWNSMWYPLSALFGFSFLGIESLHVMNGAFYLFALGFFLGGVNNILHGKFSLVNLVKSAAIPFSLYVYKPQIGSPGTDLPAALLAWIVFLLLLAQRDFWRRPDTRTLIAFVFSIYAVTIKITLLPMVLIWVFFFYCLYRSVQYTRMGFLSMLAALILTPWIGRNIVLSGYLIYPIGIIDLFSVDWILPYQYVVMEKAVGLGWARLPGPDWKTSLYMPYSVWVPKWYGWLPYHYKMVVTTAFFITLLNLGANVSSWFGWKRPFKQLDTFVLVYINTCLGVLFWFTNAPDPRFGFGFIFLALILPIAKFLEQVVEQYPVAVRYLILAVLVIYSLNHHVLSIRTLSYTGNLWLLPAPYLRMDLETQVVDGILFYFPITTDQCWDAPLPCMPVLNDGLGLRGQTLQEGFRIAQD